MSGAVVVGHPDNVIPELLNVGSSAFYIRDYSDADHMTSLLKSVISNFPLLSIEARRWATSGFTWDHCIKLWADALLKRLSEMP